MSNLTPYMLILPKKSGQGLLLTLSLLLATHRSEAALDSSVTGVTASAPLALAITSSLVEAPVKSSGDKYYRGYNFEFDASYLLATTNQAWLENPTLEAQASYMERLDSDDNEANFQNILFTLSGIRNPLTPRLNLTVPISFNYGLDQDEFHYNSYIGSLTLAPTLTYAWLQGPFAGLNLGLVNSYTRDFYQFDTNKAGGYNTLSGINLGLLIQFQPTSYGPLWNRWHFQASFAGISKVLANGAQQDPNYVYVVQAGFQALEPLQIGLKYSRTDNIYGSDGVTAQINFQYADLSLLEAYATYKF